MERHGWQVAEEGQNLGLQSAAVRGLSSREPTQSSACMSWALHGGFRQKACSHPKLVEEKPWKKAAIFPQRCVPLREKLSSPGDSIRTDASTQHFTMSHRGPRLLQQQNVSGSVFLSVAVALCLLTPSCFLFCGSPLPPSSWEKCSSLYSESKHLRLRSEP